MKRTPRGSGWRTLSFGIIKQYICLLMCKQKCASLFNMLMASHNQMQNMSIFCSRNIVFMILCVCMRAANMLTYSEYKKRAKNSDGSSSLKGYGLGLLAHDQSNL